MKARYTLGPRTDEIISKYYRDRYGNWHKLYYHYDALGNVRVLTDEAGEVGGRYEYSPFGYPLMHRGKLTIYNNYTYTGRQWERMSKLYYYRTRYYDSQTGRFTSVDRLIREVEKRKKEEGMGYERCSGCGGYIRGGIPEEIKQEELIPEIQQRKYQQPYVYVENNCVNYADPLGEGRIEIGKWGNWCGPGWSGGEYPKEGQTKWHVPAKDKLDEICKMHDACFQGYDLTTKKYLPKEKRKSKEECNEEACEKIKRIDSSDLCDIVDKYKREGEKI